MKLMISLPNAWWISGSNQWICPNSRPRLKKGWNLIKITLASSQKILRSSLNFRSWPFCEVASVNLALQRTPPVSSLPTSKFWIQFYRTKSPSSAKWTPPTPSMSPPVACLWSKTKSFKTSWEVLFSTQIQCIMVFRKLSSYWTYWLQDPTPKKEWLIRTYLWIDLWSKYNLQWQIWILRKIL